MCSSDLVAWQIGVISSDVADEGKLRGEPWILTSSTPGSEEALAANLLVGTDHGRDSLGMRMAYKALQKENAANYGFRRSDAALQVVFVSDGDDDSTSEEQQQFLTWMQKEAASTGRKVQASAVVGDVPGGCSENAAQASPGTAYVAVADQLGGVVQSICAFDFAGIARTIGDQGVEWNREFVLQAKPDAGSVVVWVNGGRTQRWVLDDQTLVFDTPPDPGATIEVDYTLGDG